MAVAETLLGWLLGSHVLKGLHPLLSPLPHGAYLQMGLPTSTTSKTCRSFFMTHLPGTASQRGADGKSGIDFGLQSAPDAPASASVPFLGMQNSGICNDARLAPRMRQMSTSKIKKTEIHRNPRKEKLDKDKAIFASAWNFTSINFIVQLSNFQLCQGFGLEHPHLATAVP